MRLLDDLSILEPKEETTRRRFLGGTTLASLGVASLGTLVIALRYLWPSVLFELPSRFRAARTADLERRRIIFLRERRLYLVRDDKGLFAQSAVCTHLGCLTRPNATEDAFFCPCHGSRFSLDGQVINGPAPLALPHFRLEKRQQDLWVDIAQEEPQDERLLV